MHSPIVDRYRRYFRETIPLSIIFLLLYNAREGYIREIL
jgi:hypothetical protein